jgi:hypothetical protein
MVPFDNVYIYTIFVSIQGGTGEGETYLEESDEVVELLLQCSSDETGTTSVKESAD